MSTTIHTNRPRKTVSYLRALYDASWAALASGFVGRFVSRIATLFPRLPRRSATTDATAVQVSDQTPVGNLMVPQVPSPAMMPARNSLANTPVRHSVTGPVIHFLDIENLCASGDLTAATVTTTIARYRHQVGVRPGDRVVVAASHHNTVAYSAVRPVLSARCLAPRSGADGADLALIEAIATTPNIDRFSAVVIASGDHIFADSHAALAARGIPTIAVSRVGLCAAAIRLAATRTVTLNSLHTADVTAPIAGTTAA